MASLQETYDDAMYDFSTGDYEAAIAKLRAVLEQDAAHFDAQLALGMVYYRKGDYPAALAEGHKALALRPNEQLVHTNLSLFYLKAGDKKLAEHHGMQARIASWKADSAGKTAGAEPPPPQAKPGAAKPAPAATPQPRFPDMPWKKKS